jgi:hypothetical protein
MALLEHMTAVSSGGREVDGVHVHLCGGLEYAIGRFKVLVWKLVIHRTMAWCSWLNLTRLRKSDVLISDFGQSDFNSFKVKSIKELNLKI